MSEFPVFTVKCCNENKNTKSSTGGRSVINCFQGCCCTKNHFWDILNSRTVPWYNVTLDFTGLIHAICFVVKLTPALFSLFLFLSQYVQSGSNSRVSFSHYFFSLPAPTFLLLLTFLVCFSDLVLFDWCFSLLATPGFCSLSLNSGFNSAFVGLETFSMMTVARQGFIFPLPSPHHCSSTATMKTPLYLSWSRMVSSRFALFQWEKYPELLSKLFSTETYPSLKLNFE